MVIILGIFWTPSKEVMEKLAQKFGYEVRIIDQPFVSFVISFFFGEIRIIKRVSGLCNHSRRCIEVRKDRLNVFWHELGHAVIFNLGGEKYFVFRKFFPLLLIIEEILAHLIGLVLSWRYLSLKENNRG